MLYNSGPDCMALTAFHLGTTVTTKRAIYSKVADFAATVVSHRTSHYLGGPLATPTVGSLTTLVRSMS